MWYEIPLSGSDETFTISIGGTPYLLTILYMGDPFDSWTMTISDSAGNGIVSNIPLVTGSDLLGPFKSIFGDNISMFVSTDGNTDAVPTETNLGSSSHLYVRVV